MEYRICKGNIFTLNAQIDISVFELYQNVLLNKKEAKKDYQMQGYVQCSSDVHPC